MNRPLIWTFATLAVVILLAALINARKPVPPPTREVLASELVQRDGRSYWQDETVPFTGFIVERYPDGALKSRSYLAEGRMHGISEGWFADGVLQVREEFRDGISHGTRLKWHPNGNPLSVASIRDGKIEGEFTRWHETGGVAEKIAMSNGLPDGLSLAYHPDGSLKARVTLKAGVVQEQQFWPRGERFEPGQPALAAR